MGLISFMGSSLLNGLDGLDELRPACSPEHDANNAGTNMLSTVRRHSAPHTVVKAFKVQDGSLDAQNAEVADKQAIQAAVWKATTFDSSMTDALSSSSSSSSSSLNGQQTAGAIVGKRK
eukprot:1161025-Pelagomonas_calceolata.AAC.8